MSTLVKYQSAAVLGGLQAAWKGVKHYRSRC